MPWEDVPVGLCGWLWACAPACGGRGGVVGLGGVLLVRGGEGIGSAGGGKIFLGSKMGGRGTVVG